jgi:hypothetical protein
VDVVCKIKTDAVGGGVVAVCGVKYTAGTDFMKLKVCPRREEIMHVFLVFIEKQSFGGSYFVM